MKVRIRIEPLPSSRNRNGHERRATALDTTPPEQADRRAPALGHSSLVALGILISRITGLLRETLFAHYLGNSRMAGVFRAAFRIPNLLSTLFGEGVLSAAFVTVYAKLRAHGEDEEAEHLAEAVFGILCLVAALFVLVGVLAAPVLIDVITPGFHGEDRTMTIHLVRILFPGAALLVLSAWCLGVLNSHRKFLLSYTAPVAMNATMMAALVYGGHRAPELLVSFLAWACVLGSALQFLVQVPHVLQLLPAFRPSIEVSSEHVRMVLRNFAPVFVSRGVVQLSAYVDQIIASFLGAVAVSTLGYGLIIAALPVSLFSMAVSAAELPALAGERGDPEEVAAALRSRLISGLNRIAFFVVPSAVAFLLLGDVLAAALYSTGRFDLKAAVSVWATLAGASVGLVATSLGRLYSSAFYALLDTKTPLRFAVIRVCLTTGLGFICALWIPSALGLDFRWSLAALTATAGVSGWVEFFLLRRALSERIGLVSVTASYAAKLWGTAGTAGIAAYALKHAIGLAHPRLAGALIIGVYGAIYIGGTYWLGIEQSRQTVSRLRVRAGV